MRIIAISLLITLVANVSCASASRPASLPHWHLIRSGSPITEPYPPVHGGSFSPQHVKYSPDPLQAYRWKHTSSSAGLQTYALRPVAVSSLTPHSFTDLKSVTTPYCDITVKGTGALRVDFGTESAAWLEFDSPDLNGSKVEMGISEFNAPAHETDAIGTPEKVGNTYRVKLNAEYYEGVRFGWIYVKSFTGKPWHITGVRAVCQIKPTNYNGSFSCSNPMLTRIWYTGAYTVKLNLLKDYFGAILMNRGDRISWVGDAHIAQSASMVAFGNFNFVKQNLDLSAGKGNGIASYYLYWVLSLVDYYRYTGDTAELTKYYPLVKSLLTKAAANFAHPHISFYGWDDRLGGFANSENPINREAYRMLFVETCRRVAWAAGAAGNLKKQSYYSKLAAKYALLIQNQPDWVKNADLFSASDAVNSGGPTTAQDDVLKQNCFANRLDRVSYSPFNEYFVVEAMARLHLWDQALETVLDDWGGQINYGGTTFFEVYFPGWNSIIPTNGGIPSSICGTTSLCHPWSAGCTTWLTQWIAGIRPTAPGFDTADIVPHLGTTLSWVDATVPTPHGTISEAFNGKQGVGSYVVPAGTVARIGIPRMGREIKTITVNGHLLWESGKSRSLSSISSVTQSKNFVYFNGVQSGKYHLKIVYKGISKHFKPEPFIYPVKVVKKDRDTEGNWEGVYGKQGYVLFADGPKEADLEVLPDYVQSVTCLWGNKTQWPSSGSDIRALAEDATNSKHNRIAGVFYSDLTSEAPQAAVDIRLKYPHSYQLALYAVDFDHKNRKQVITIEDLATRTVIAPLQALAHFSKGQYIVFECHDSVRVRFDPIRGGNAVLSGLFFGPSRKR